MPIKRPGPAVIVGTAAAPINHREPNVPEVPNSVLEAPSPDSSPVPTTSSNPDCTATLQADLAYLHRYKSMLDSLRSVELQTARPLFLGKLEGRTARILWDTGASTNFVSQAFVERHGLVPQPSVAPLKVSMGDGTTYSCHSSLMKPHLTMGPVEDDSWTFTVAPLQGVDVILGTPWWAARLPSLDFKSGYGYFELNGVTAKLFMQTEITPAVDSISLEAITAKPAWKEEMWFVMAPIHSEPPDSSLDLSDDVAIRDVLQSFSSLLRHSLPDQLPPPRSVDHHIELLPNAKPPSLPPYRLPLAYHAEMQGMLSDLLKKRFIQPSKSPFSSPVIFVKKKSGGLRMCVDYRALNKITIKNRFPLPRMDDLLDKLHGATVFSSLDAVSGYYQIRVAPEDVPKTAFRTTTGHFEFNVLPFGLTNAPATFQSLMNGIILEHDLGDFVVVYLDDILVFSKSVNEHAHHLRRVFEALAAHSIFLSRAKCTFARSEVIFLGHLISAKGVCPDPSKADAITSWPSPANLGELRSFLGAAGFHRRHIPHYSSIAAPLTDLQSSTVPFVWRDTQEDAFTDLKKALSAPVLLSPPQLGQPFLLYCDASLRGLGSVLYQAQSDGKLKPIAFLSRKLSPTESRYTTRDMELLALMHSLREWRHYLLGTRVTVYSDHRSVTDFLTQRTMPSTVKYARWLDLLAEFDLDIKYIRGKANVVADALSRRRHLLPPEEGEAEEECFAMSASTILTNLQESMLTAASEDTYYQQLLQSPLDSSEFVLDAGLLYKIIRQSPLVRRLVVPESMRSVVLHEAHDTITAGHLGVARTKAALSSRFWWPSLNEDVKSYVQACVSCQKNKPRNHAPYGRLQPLENPCQPWEHVHIDFFGPFPATTKGFTYCMSVSDRLTRMVHFLPCFKTITGADAAALFVSNVFRLHGLPKKIISDRDPRFTSEFWQGLFKTLGTKLAMSTALHPQTDGVAERNHRSIETMLRHYINMDHTDWDEKLHILEFAYNNAKHEATGHSPFELNFGFHPTVPLTLDTTSEPTPTNPLATDFLDRLRTSWSYARESIAHSQSLQKARVDRRRKDKTFEVGDLVLVHKRVLTSAQDGPAAKLTPVWRGPFEIVEKPSDVNVKVKLGSHRSAPIKRFHVQDIKPFVGTLDPSSHHGSEPGPAHLIAGEPAYVVDRFIDREQKFSKTNKLISEKILVRWLNYGPEHDSWVNVSQLRRDLGRQVFQDLYDDLQEELAQAT